MKLFPIINRKKKVSPSMAPAEIISRIRQAIDHIYEKYEGNPLIEQEDIMGGFEDIITDYYQNQQMIP